MSDLLLIEISLRRKQNGEIFYCLTESESFQSFQSQDEFIEVLNQKFTAFQKLIRNPLADEYLSEKCPATNLFDSEEVNESIFSALELDKFADWITEKLKK